MKQEVAFEVLGLLKNKQNLAHSLTALKYVNRYGFGACVWQGGSIAPPTKFQQSSPRGTFDLDVRDLVGTCITRRLKKKVSWCHALNPTGSRSS